MLNENKLLSLISNRILELIILPTEQCNFRCVYCYEDFSIGKMQRNKVEAIKQLIRLRIETLDFLKISWFGGEPLAAKDIVFDISEFISELRKQYSHIHYISDMTTNGFQLKKNILTKLCSLGVTSYQISLDGTEDAHDKSRKRMNGSGSFKTIWDNLIAAKMTDLTFSILLRLHITPENIENMYELIDNIKLEFGNDGRFRIFFKAIENLGGPRSGTFKTIHRKDKAEIINQLYHYLGDTVKTQKLNDNGPYVCYASKTNSLIIRADGKIGKCTVALTDARNSIGQLNDDGTIQVDHTKLALWLRGIKTQDLNELQCPMHNLPSLKTSSRSIPIVIKE